MSDYTKSTNFASKDSLASGNPAKIVKGTEIDTEFNNIATAVSTKADASGGNLTSPSISGGTISSATISSSTFSGTLSNPTVTNYTETVYTANSGTAITLSLTNGTVQVITLTGNATITMPTAAAGKSFVLLLKQDSTGSRTVTWTTVKWAGGTAPTLTTTASRLDVFSFFSDGTNWYGFTGGQNFTV